MALIAVAPHNCFSPRNTFRQPDNPAWLLQGSFYPAPSLALCQCPKNAVSHPETSSEICLGGNHGPRIWPIWTHLAH